MDIGYLITAQQVSCLVPGPFLLLSSDGSIQGEAEPGSPQ